MRRGYIYATILLLSLTLIGLNYLFTPQVSPPPGSKPLFLGYRSNTIRIEALNLTQLSQIAKASGYTANHRVGDDEYAEGTVPTPSCRFNIAYTYTGNYTVFSLWFHDDGNATGWLWRLLQDSLSLNDAELQQVKKDAYSNYEADDFNPHLGTNIDGVKPDWAILAKYLGAETERETYRVGQVRIFFDSNTTMTLNTDALWIEGKESGSGAVFGVNVDGDSDICIYVDYGAKLKDPISLFTPMFEKLGIPESELAKLNLEESWAYPL